MIPDATDDRKKAAFREKANDYMLRAEKIQALLEEEKRAGQVHTQTRIEQGSTGHSYQTLFGKWLTPEVTEITVEDPYVRSHHQVRQCQQKKIIIFCPENKFVIPKLTFFFLAKVYLVICYFYFA